MGKISRWIEPLFRLTLWGSALGGVGLLTVVPEIGTIGFGHPLLTAQVHLLTLGGLLTGVYLVQHRLWAGLYGADAPWVWPLPLIWLFHGPGLAVFAWGLLQHNTLVAYVGGHYMVPTGIVLSLVHGWRAAWKRETGRPRMLAAHLPGLGLALAMSLGSLLVMDARTLQYGIYNPNTIFVHLIAGGFLFVVPFLLLPEMLARMAAAQTRAEVDASPLSPHAANLPLLGWYGHVIVLTGGVLLVALALVPPANPNLLPIGLALPGASLIWLNASRRGGLRWRELPQRVGRWTLGLLLVYVAIRLWRGAEGGELLHWARLGVVFFLCGFALPELAVLTVWTREREPGQTPSSPVPCAWGVMVAGALALLLGQHLLLPTLIRLGGAVWLAGWVWLGWLGFRSDAPGPRNASP